MIDRFVRVNYTEFALTCLVGIGSYNFTGATMTQIITFVREKYDEAMHAFSV